MIHHEKIKEVHNYLEKDLSGKTPEYKYDASQKAAIFTLRIDENTVTISMLEEFFDDNGINEIKKKLKDFRLLEFVRHGWSKQITVTKFGLKLEDF